MAKTMLKKWPIGGLDQWIMIKEDQAEKTKPVLLFLHGGYRLSSNELYRFLS